MKNDFRMKKFKFEAIKLFITILKVMLNLDA